MRRGVVLTLRSAQLVPIGCRHFGSREAASWERVVVFDVNRDTSLLGLPSYEYLLELSLLL